MCKSAFRLSSLIADKLQLPYTHDRGGLAWVCKPDDYEHSRDEAREGAPAPDTMAQLPRLPGNGQCCVAIY